MFYFSDAKKTLKRFEKITDELQQVGFKASFISVDDACLTLYLAASVVAV